MIGMLKTQLIGRDALQELLRGLPRQTEDRVKAVLNTHSLNIASNAKQLCPVRKAPGGIGGRLRSSIRQKFYRNGMTAEVGTNVEYASFVEFGTGRRGATTLPAGTPLPDGYAHGPRPGMGAQPYLYPAFVREQPSFERDLIIAVTKGK